LNNIHHEDGEESPSFSDIDISPSSHQPYYTGPGLSVMEKACMVIWNFSGPLAVIISTIRSIYKLVLIHLQRPRNLVRNLPHLPSCCILVSKQLCS